MSISSRRLALTTATAIAAALTGGIVAAGTAHADTAPIMGTINGSNVIDRTGPGVAYPEAGPVSANDKPYNALCASAPRVSVPRLPDPSTVWIQLGSTATALFGQPSQPEPIGYVPVDKVSLTQNGKTVSWTALPTCPPPPPPPGESVSAIPPGADKPTNVCKSNILEPGPDTLTFSSEQTIDVEFDAALASKIEVSDPDTEKEGSGTALPAAGNTPHGSTARHFTEKANGTGITTHHLLVTVEGAVGGPNEEGGELVEGDVSYIVRSTACGKN
jgi:hypothetical protein